jgi:hypothetical protein
VVLQGDWIAFQLAASPFDTALDPETAIDAFRAGDDLVADLAFTLVYDAHSVTVELLAASYASAEELRGAVQAAVDQAFEDAGLGHVDIDVTLDAGGKVRIALGDAHVLGSTATAQAALAAARDDFDLPEGASFELQFDGRTVAVSVMAGEFATAEALRAHIQAAVDDALVDSGRGLAGDIVVSLDAQGELRLALQDTSGEPHTLGDPTTAEDAITLAREDYDLPHGASFSLAYDGQTLEVSVAAATFETAEELRAAIQLAVDGALVAAGLGAAGDIVVRLDAEGAVRFAARDVLGDTAQAEDDVAQARTGNDLPEGASFDLHYDGATVHVDVAAGTLASAEALRAHIQGAVDQALADAGAAAGDVVVTLDAAGAVRFAQRDVLGDTAQAEAEIAQSRALDYDLPDGVTFELVYDGEIVEVSVAAGTFASAEELRAHIQAAIDDAALDIVVTVDAGDKIRFALGGPHTLGGGSAAEAAIAQARDDYDLPGGASFSLAYDGETVHVAVDAGEFETAADLRDHIQAAVDAALAAAGLGIAGDIEVSVDRHSVGFALRSHALQGLDVAAEDVIDARRDDANFPDAFDFTLLYDGREIRVEVDAASFATAEEMRLHIQAAVDAALGRAGDIVVTLDAGGEVHFVLGAHSLAGRTEAQAAIAEGRDGNDLLGTLSFDLVYDGETVTVSLAGGTFETAEELRAHIQAAVDAVLIDAGLGVAGDVAVSLDGEGALQIALGEPHTLGDTASAE